MWFKNKLTGVNWHIVDESHIKRLKADENYEIVADPTKPKTTRKKATPKTKE
ncbi:hypothetical protein [Sporolactobacillus terrae]|uniref:hypothetical protein n=1 Tax=Sporolactobacillus terrae TaxID=269673 RepID=UPI00159BAF98|nr:hypothetical protein [Sporolactobacillus terrae]